MPPARPPHRPGITPLRALRQPHPTAQKNTRLLLNILLLLLLLLPGPCCPAAPEEQGRGGGTSGGPSEGDRSSPATSNTAERIERFNAWFRENYGGQLKLSVRPTEGAGGGYGVYTSERIEEGEPYLRIPVGLLMSEGTMLQRSPDLHRAISGVQDRLLRIALFLMHERWVKRKGSFFRHYINTIPHLMDTPQYYSDAELQELEGADIAPRVRRERVSWKEQHRQLNASIFAKNPGVFPQKPFGSYSKFRWAKSILATRSIWVGGRPCLVPFLDMVNCKEGPDPSKVHATHAEGGTHATTYAAWGFGAGDEVFENYGQRDFVYFLNHGFSVPNNSHDCIDVARHVAFPGDRGSGGAAEGRDAEEDRLVVKAVQRLGLRAALARRAACVAPPAKPVPVELFQLLRVAALSGAEARQHAADPSQRFAAPLSAGNERRALGLLIDVGHRFLEGFPTTPREDELILQQGGISFRLRMIVTFRLSQKRQAMSLVRWADAQISTLSRGG